MSWRLENKYHSPKILSHISGAVTRMAHHPHHKDYWNCVVRLLCYLSQQQNQGQNKLMNNVMAVIIYLDDIIVIG